MADIRTTKVITQVIPGLESDIRTTKAVAQVVPLLDSDIRTTKVLVQVIVMPQLVSEVQDQGGFDLYFDLPILNGVTGYLSVRTNITTSQMANEEETEIRFYDAGGNDTAIAVHHLITGDLVEKVIIQWEDGADCRQENKIRIVWANKFCSVYINERWAHTFAFPYIEFVTSTPDLRFYVDATWDGSATIDLITNVELSDWREAIYVDTETSLFSALSAIIQDRPVEIYTTSEGKLKFSYNETRDQLTINPFVREHTKSKSADDNAGSEAIVYAADVELVEDADYTATKGFVTRVLRLPTLDVGAQQAAEVLLHRAKEREVTHELRTRPDLRVESGDLLLIYYIDQHEGEEVSDYMIVESISMMSTEPGSQMVIRGRSYVS